MGAGAVALVRVVFDLCPGERYPDRYATFRTTDGRKLGHVRRMRRNRFAAYAGGTMVAREATYEAVRRSVRKVFEGEAP